MKSIIVERIRDVKMPTKGNETDSGIDFYVPFIDVISLNQDMYATLHFGASNEIPFFVLPPGANIKLPLGVKVDLPKGYDMTFFNRSSIASNKGLIVGACVIDNGYRGELVLNLINTSNENQSIFVGDKIVQGIVRKVEQTPIFEGKVENNTDRGEGGFGSTD